MNKTFRVWDIAIILFILIAALITFFIVFPKDGEALYAVIEKDGKETERYRFSDIKENEPVISEIKTDLGSVFVEIGSDYAMIKDSPCHSKLCVKTGKITKSGQAAVCLPCRVSVRIGGKSQYDGMTG